jgi:hypothetical protein
MHVKLLAQLIQVIWDVLIQMMLRHALMICGNAQKSFATQRVLGKTWLTANQCLHFNHSVVHPIFRSKIIKQLIFNAHMNFANQITQRHLLLLHAKLLVQKQKRMQKKH